jgi:hypothetical protein
VATDRLVKVSKNEFGIGKSYSVQQMISCVPQKYPKDGCSGSSVDIAWSKLNQLNKNYTGYHLTVHLNLKNH